MFPTHGERLMTLRYLATFLAYVTSIVSASLVMPSTAATAWGQDISEAVSDALGVPKVDAFLPDRYSIEKTEALPIDGVWMISANRKKIRIEAGRAYALDPWLHLFTLRVQRDMVVLQDFQRLGPGEYTAYDLPLLGQATMRLGADGNLSVSVAGALGPARYKLIKREVDDRSGFETELDILAGRISEPVREAPPAPEEKAAPAPEAEADPLANCVNLGIDPNTGGIICTD